MWTVSLPVLWVFIVTNDDRTQFNNIIRARTSAAAVWNFGRRVRSRSSSGTIRRTAPMLIEYVWLFIVDSIILARTQSNYYFQMKSIRFSS